MSLRGFSRPVAKTLKFGEKARAGVIDSKMTMESKERMRMATASVDLLSVSEGFEFIMVFTSF